MSKFETPRTNDGDYLYRSLIKLLWYRTTTILTENCILAHNCPMFENNNKTHFFV